MIRLRRKVRSRRRKGPSNGIHAFLLNGFLMEGPLRPKILFCTAVAPKGGRDVFLKSTQLWRASDAISKLFEHLCTELHRHSDSLHGLLGSQLHGFHEIPNRRHPCLFRTASFAFRSRPLFQSTAQIAHILQPLSRVVLYIYATFLLLAFILQAFQWQSKWAIPSTSSLCSAIVCHKSETIRLIFVNVKFNCNPSMNLRTPDTHRPRIYGFAILQGRNFLFR